MSAGYNLKVNIFRMDAQPDDVVGGYQATGVLVYEGINGRLFENRPQDVLVQQGVEVEDTYTLLLVPSNLLLYSRDEIEITKPYNHPLCGKRLAVMTGNPNSVHPSDFRSVLKVYVRRKEYANPNFF